jgi:hypothetical protein
MVSNQLLAVMQLMEGIKRPTGTYWQAVGQATRTYTDSPENLATIARGNAALLEIETAVRRWVAEHPEKRSFPITGHAYDGEGFAAPCQAKGFGTACGEVEYDHEGE